jgi:hypothetical protein
MRKLGLRAVIAGASVLTVMGAVDGADLLGQTHADPYCAASGRTHAHFKRTRRRKRIRPRLCKRYLVLALYLCRTVRAAG